MRAGTRPAHDARVPAPQEVDVVFEDVQRRDICVPVNTLRHNENKEWCVLFFQDMSTSIDTIRSTSVSVGAVILRIVTFTMAKRGTG